MSLDPSKFIVQQNGEQTQNEIKPTHPISPLKLEIDPTSKKLWTPSDFEAIDKLLTQYSSTKNTDTN